MKHVRKVMAIGLAIVFIIALVIGAGVMLSVRNVNVSFIEYSGNYSDEYKEARKNLDSLKGSGLLFIGDGDVYGKVGDNEIFAVERYEKKFPCTINIVVRERIETFTYKSGNGYSVYDERGRLIRGDEESEPVNRLDGCPNVLIESGADEIEDIAVLCGYFKDVFFKEDEPKALRRLVKKIRTEERLGCVDIIFNSGLTVTLFGWKTSGEQKIKKAYEEYGKLDEYGRLNGMITVIDRKGGSAR
ncbi:MAG: hypothetical protein NC131_01835 [Roseburia sp.]|nr:hypothetical protein [Roseburia sp.]